MQSFLEEVIQEVWDSSESLENVVFVLPSKRAGTFLRNSIAKIAKKTLFSPEIHSIEAFVEQLSGLAYASNTEQLFQLYDTYLKTTKEKKDSFYSFSKWGQTLLQDFNEIDRYLIDTHTLFTYLADIQEIDHWYLQKEKTKMMEEYIKFWNNLEALYTNFNAALKNKGMGHQGLVYREADQKLESYLSTTNKRHVFIGFNALNTAESNIIQKILASDNASIYWDIDAYFLNDPIHDAGFFIRQHRNSWDYFKTHLLKGGQTHYLRPKNIQVVGLPKNISQAKYIGTLLNDFQLKDKALLKNTAIVLGDETLLNPVMNAIPGEIEGINITMGYPLHKTPLASLFLQFFELYLHIGEQGWFYRHTLDFLSHPYIQRFLATAEKNGASDLMEAIKHRNWAYITLDKIAPFIQKNPLFGQLFFEQGATPSYFIEKCLNILLHLKESQSEIDNTLDLEYLYRFYTLFNQLKEWVGQHSFVNDLKSLQGLYRELLSSETLDFQGEPLKGLQIMGMLESRNLDFETIIISSVNEGILPSGKSNNSFIPFDLKKTFGLPTYKEKDAVYTYHFYRLLQRAKNVYILYNTEPDVLEGGEKSRLITQMLTDENILPHIKQTIAAPTIQASVKTSSTIAKDAHLLQLIKIFAQKGFSPTSLSNYIRNPIAFYTQHILGIDTRVEVEETIAANTFGTVVHNTLEDLYTPYINTILTKTHLETMKEKIKPLVRKHFGLSYHDGNLSKGKNLIAFHVIVRYVENFIKMEIKEVQKHQIEILALEQRMDTQLQIPEMDYPVRLKGTLDRIDRKDGQLRIIDYKTGKVNSTAVEIVHWDDIVSDYSYSKAFQLLCYAILYNTLQPIDRIGAGIISFKNLQAGLLQFATKEKKGSRVKNTVIDQDTLVSFQEQLYHLIREICTAQTPFIEKEV